MSCHFCCLLDTNANAIVRHQTDISPVFRGFYTNSVRTLHLEKWLDAAGADEVFALLRQQLSLNFICDH